MEGSLEILGRERISCLPVNDLNPAQHPCGHQHHLHHCNYQAHTENGHVQY